MFDEADKMAVLSPQGAEPPNAPNPKLKKLPLILSGIPQAQIPRALLAVGLLVILACILHWIPEMSFYTSLATSLAIAAGKG